MPILPNTNRENILFTFLDDGILTLLLLIEVYLIFEDVDVLAGEVLFNLFIRLAVVLACALHNVNLKHPRLFSSYISIE